MKVTRLKIKTEPTVEPVSLAEVKNFLKLDSGAFATNITATLSITQASKSVTPNYGIVGAAVEIGRAHV